MITEEISEGGGDPRLVVGKDHFNAIRYVVRNDTGIIRKRVSCFAIGPSAFIVQSLRQIVMEETGIGLDVPLEKFINQAVIKCPTFLVDLASAFRKNARPSNGKR